MNAIEITGLNKEYVDFSLRELNLVLPAGKIMGLVGENGAGKSTTIKLIMNALSRSSGQVRVLGLDNQSPDFNQLKNQIGVVLDEAYFPEMLNAQNVGSIMQSTYQNWNPEEYQGYLKRFALPDKKPFKDYSRGMKMKLALAVALAHDPQLLILDEATSGLDPLVREEILDLFADFCQTPDHSILLSSHIISDLEKICDYIAFLHQGKLLFCEPKEQLLAKYALLKVSPAQFQVLPSEAVISHKYKNGEMEALVLAALVSEDLPKKAASLEEIILFLVRGAE